MKKKWNFTRILHDNELTTLTTICFVSIDVVQIFPGILLHSEHTRCPYSPFHPSEIRIYTHSALSVPMSFLSEPAAEKLR